MPAYALLRDDRLEIWDCHDDAYSRSQLALQRDALLRQGLDAHGVIYRVLCASKIRQEPHFSNCRLVLSGAGHYPTQEETDAVRRLVSGAGGLSARAIAEAMGRPPSFVHEVYALVSQGRLQLADPDTLMTIDSALVEA